MSAVLYLHREADGTYVSDGERYTLAEASDLIEPFMFAAVSRFDGSLIAGDSRERVAVYGAPRYAPDLAQEIYAPDWHCHGCGCSGPRGTDCGCDCEYQGIPAHPGGERHAAVR